ncbi:MAG: response regulator [Actinomycetota bacterium]|nr:response regulator [Actinomycetota bacterium]
MTDTVLPAQGAARALRVLVVDDEPDVAAVTRLSLRGMRHSGRPVELSVATTGAAAVEAMRADPAIAVILLDVVMETDTAGLDACRAIRDELGNRYVRILLRTGQPGVAPERATIDDYDIDGYLPKTELTTNRLYAAVRTALKAYEELIDLDRYRQVLLLLNETAVSLHPYEPFDVMLQRILGAAVALVPTPLAVVGLHVRPPGGAEPRNWLLHLSTSTDDDANSGPSAAVAAERVEAYLAEQDEPEAGSAAGGYLAPFSLHHGLGEGWLYVDGVVADSLARAAMPLLAAHAANALYSAVVQPSEAPVQHAVIRESSRQ